MTPEEIEAELKTRQAVVDINSGNIVSQQGRILKGECSKCGKCCLSTGVPYPDEDNLRCRHLREKSDGDGMQIYICDIYSIRPVGCAFWPEIIDFENNQVPEECTLYFE